MAAALLSKKDKDFYYHGGATKDAGEVDVNYIMQQHYPEAPSLRTGNTFLVCIHTYEKRMAMQYTIGLTQPGDTIILLSVFKDAKLREVAEKTLEEAAKEVIARTKGGVECVSVMVEGSVRERVCQAARDLKVDFVAIGGSGMWSRALGISHVAYIVERCPLPVILVKTYSITNPMNWWILYLDFTRACHHAFHVVRPMVQDTTEVDLVYVHAKGEESNEAKLRQYKERFHKEHTASHVVCRTSTVEGNVKKLLPPMCEERQGPFLKMATLLIVGLDEDTKDQYVDPCIKNANAMAIMLVKTPLPTFDGVARTPGWSYRITCAGRGFAPLTTLMPAATAFEPRKPEVDRGPAPGAIAFPVVSPPPKEVKGEIQPRLSEAPSSPARGLEGEGGEGAGVGADPVRARDEVPSPSDPDKPSLTHSGSHPDFI